MYLYLNQDRLKELYKIVIAENEKPNEGEEEEEEEEGEDGEDEDKKKKKKKKGPKQAKSAYIIYTSASRSKVKADHPELSNKELMSKLGEMWKALSSEDKVEWIAKADEDKKRFGDLFLHRH